MNYFLLRPTELNYVLGTMLITQIVFVPAIIFAANRIGKSSTLQVAVLLWAIAVILLAMLTPQWPDWSIYAISVLSSIGVIGCIVIPWIMYPDVTDVGELAFGKRSSGSFGGIMTFLRKFSAAIGIFIVSQILDFAGYIKPDGTTPDATPPVQPESVIIALKVIVAGLPIVLLVFVYIFARKYPLDKKMHTKLNSYLEWKRGNADNNPLGEQELKELKKSLI